MKINKPQIVQENDAVTYRVEVKSVRGDAALWYSLPKSFGELVSDSSDAALVGLLIPAMCSGEDIHINGKVSERLLYNLTTTYQRLLRHVIPSLRQVKIFAADVFHGKTEPARGVATGFSGGVDSFCVLADHYFSGVSERFKITHLLFNNVGSHGSGGGRLFRERYDRLASTADLLGLPFLMIDSNLDSFYGKELEFQQTHTPRNASVALMLQGGIDCYLYASTYSYPDTFVGPTYDMAYTDPITLPLLSTDTLDAVSVGGEYTRVEKTLRVADIPDSYAAIDVCVSGNNTSGYTNCSTCWKCLRTLATLEIAGQLECYSDSFDLDAYKNRRDEYFTILLGSRDPLLKEIIQYAKERNYSFPISSRIVHSSRVIGAKGLSNRVMRKMKSRKRLI